MFMQTYKRTEKCVQYSGIFHCCYFMGTSKLFILRLKYFAHLFQFEMQMFEKDFHLKPLGRIHCIEVVELFNSETPGSQRKNTESEFYVLCTRYNIICPSICLHAYMYAMVTL